VIVLALTDQFSGGQSPGVNMAREYASKLPSPYERHYYSGIIFERQARALVAKAHAAVYAYDAFREAMTCYEEAERVRPSGNDDALLRWNSCLRTIRRERLEPQTPDIEKVPRHFLFVPKLMETRTGKIDRRANLAQVAAQHTLLH
jgi:hypothetical protein